MYFKYIGKNKWLLGYKIEKVGAGMKKKQIYEGIVNKMNFPNKAVVTTVEVDDNGNKKEIETIVKDGIIGQKVSFIVNKVRRDKCQGRIVEVLEKSPLETEEPFCPNFLRCGGCNYQTIAYSEQLKLKENQVLNLIETVYGMSGENAESYIDEQTFMNTTVNYEKNKNLIKDLDNSQQKYKGKTYIVDEILPSPEVTEYRNKMEFSFGDEVKGGPLTLGLHKKGSFHDIIDAECCKIVHKDFIKILSCVRDYCILEKIPHYRKNIHQGVLRHLLIRRSAYTGEILVALVVSSQQKIDWSTLAEKLKKLSLDGEIVGFLLITNDGLCDVVQSDKTEIIYGKDFITDIILGLKFKVSTFSFFQTNTKGAEILYKRARDYILGAEKLTSKVVFDLYSGTGTIAQIIAPIAKKVVGVEIVQEAVEAARENAKENGLTNCEFIAGDVLKVLDDIEETPDFIILDPPRDGIHPKALRKIIGYGVQNIIYISCKPTSLVRDLEVFKQEGYELERVGCVDMFPGTCHVETVVLMSKVNPNK